MILGLLTGGILAGQSLIRASELRSITADYSRIITAVQSFRDKYLALPGDMTNATKFWGAAHATPATCRTTASTTTATCDGDGNGQVADNGTTSNESYRFWQQLANAGLFEGQYSGITQGSTNYSSTKANAPSGKISNSLWFTWNWGVPISGSSDWFDGVYGNRLSIGGVLANAEPAGAILKAEEVWNIDTKLDDGRPAQGKVRVQWSTGCTNATSSAMLNADYQLTNTAVACFPMFLNAY